jgi:4-alpha-glucanotransferase
MNLPGRPSGNWGWRLQPEQLNNDLAQRLGKLSSLYGRERLAVDEHRDMI